MSIRQEIIKALRDAGPLGHFEVAERIDRDPRYANAVILDLLAAGKVRVACRLPRRPTWGSRERNGYAPTAAGLAMLEPSYRYRRTGTTIVETPPPVKGAIWEVWA